MSANKFNRGSLWGVLLGALVAAMGVATFFVFVQSGEAKQVADERPPYASITPKIVGGTEVTNGKYPFMAFVRFTWKGQDVRACGGTLIDRDSVLTVAHCFFDQKGKALPKSIKLQVIVGRTVRSSNQGQVRSWKRVDFHPAYNPSNKKRLYIYDAAVIELRRPVWGITPIKLATSKQDYLERPGRNATVNGWGNTIASSPFDPPPPGGPEIPDRMHEAQVPIVSDSIVEQAYDPRRETRLTRPLIYSPPIMIAAGGNGKDTCRGDSGGPLFFALAPDGDDSDNGDGKIGDGDNGGFSGKYTQIGITSFGPGCAYKDFPGAYTEVNNPSIRSFIINAASK